MKDQTHLGPYPYDRGCLFAEINVEQVRQDAKWGEQNHPDGTGGPGACRMADIARDLCDEQHRAGAGTWRHILNEEVAEAFAEESQENLRRELVQVAAVAVAWIEAIDRRAVSR